MILPWLLLAGKFTLILSGKPGFFTHGVGFCQPLVSI
jgi:hypothetical protein